MKVERSATDVGVDDFLTLVCFAWRGVLRIALIEERVIESSGRRVVRFWFEDYSAEGKVELTLLICCSLMIFPCATTKKF